MVVTLAEEFETLTERFRRESKILDSLESFPCLFEWRKLKKKCKLLDLEDTYQMYFRKILRNYLKTFIKMHMGIAIVHSIAVVSGDHLPGSTYYDCYLYMVGAGLASLSASIYLRKHFIKHYPFAEYLISWATCIIMALTDILIGIIAFILNKDKLRYCYCGYTISSIYLFMPVSSYSPLILLGTFVSSMYGGYSAFLSLSKSEIQNVTIRFDQCDFLTDLFYIIGLNFVGLCFRARRDYATRRVFITRRLNIEEGLLLNYAKDQEKNLLISIIPAQIANKLGQEVKKRIERCKFQNIMKTDYASEFARKLFIEPHYDVSIIFADIVNYTQLTTTLDVKTMVETLHDLFHRFDMACDEFNVMRIKFLGDCYYGVSGLPQTLPFHAHSCIEFGRSAIEHIKEVRDLRKINIDMRIGVHSGNVLSGIIGAAKWQYDIWSKDVDIASHLEQTGLPGRVHISRTTLQYVSAYYDYESGTEEAKLDPLLIKERMTTYLIIGPNKIMTESKEWQIYKKWIKSNSQNRRFISGPLLNEFYAEELPHMNHKLVKFRANKEIERELRKLPIYKLGIKNHLFTRMPRVKSNDMEDFTANRSISSMCLLFDDWNWERSYNQDTDQLLKISVAMSFVILGCVMIMQAVNKIPNIPSLMALYAINTTYVMILMILVWFRSIWLVFGQFPLKRSRKKYVSVLLHISTLLEATAVLRIAIYVSLIFCILSIAFGHLIFCDPLLVENNNDQIQEFLRNGKRAFCFDGWAVTQCVVLCMGVVFTFSHLPYIIQLLLGLLIIIYYLIVILIEFPIVYESSLPTNKTVNAEASHIWNTLTMFFMYQLMCRHIIYVSKIEAISKWRLEKKKDNARVTNESIKILLHNILPTHVVNIYLSKRLSNEPYYEQHEYVAVMFATINYPQSGSIDLRLLNELICDFDEILSFYKSPIKVEKIKVANLTYMAACGFDASFDEAPQYQLPGVRQSLLLPNKKSFVSITTSITSHHSSPQNYSTDHDTLTADESNNEPHTVYDETSTDAQKRNVLKTISYFALDLLRSINSFNIRNTADRIVDEPPIMLRIGISSGEVMAGVVGSSQAHYDIWGNAVNMASRMDSTGEPGRIQVTEEAAKTLKSARISCKLRGMTYVKGRGKIPTYFLEVTDDFEFLKISKKDSNDKMENYQED